MAGSRKQCGGFSANNFLILLRLGIGVTRVDELHDLSRSDRIGGFRHVRQQRHVAKPDHQLERPGVNKVADQNTGGIAKFGVGGGHAPSKRGEIHYVVVKKRRRMNELHHRGEADMGILNTAQGLRRQQYQQGPHALAACLDDVMANTLDHFHVGLQ